MTKRREVSQIDLVCFTDLSLKINANIEINLIGHRS